MMKQLWKHIKKCKDKKCPVEHCVSSRYALTHYRLCEDVLCDICLYIRYVIKKAHRKKLCKKRSVAEAGHGKTAPCKKQRRATV
jgi:hypothetical protein